MPIDNNGPIFAMWHFVPESACTTHPWFTCQVSPISLVEECNIPFSCMHHLLVTGSLQSHNTLLILVHLLPTLRMKTE